MISSPSSWTILRAKKLGFIGLSILLLTFVAWKLFWTHELPDETIRKIAQESFSRYLKDNGATREDFTEVAYDPENRIRKSVEFVWAGKKRTNCVVNVFVSRRDGHTGLGVFCDGKMTDSLVSWR